MESSRRAFLAAGLAVGTPPPVRRRVRFGLCADVHQDVIHDAGERLGAFIGAARAAKCEWVLQLGDFCRPDDRNRSFLRIFDAFPGPKYHVLGNHEIDDGFTWAQARQFLGMSAPYYSFDHGGWHFVVLDGNERRPDGKTEGYPRYIGAAQAAWLAADLKHNAAATIVFSHQSLEDERGVENGAEIRAILEAANREAGWAKVAACFSGHHHIDYATTIAGIHYVQVNSMSYSWLGERYQSARYGDDIDKRFPYIRYTAPYAEPLYALVTLEPDGRIDIRGRATKFVGPSPWELGMEDRPGTSNSRKRLVPRISDRMLRTR
jgi:3',5'-cyclic AMP phosphodiesterase CpdA